ncbi:hypothetical protein A4G99_01840 [Haladaptatus sp. R4]|uniref:hypothetical protein n=1 Tax=unclassified Haladaptatus TaxID=2622732 RepID=UPI0007B4D0D3|nr:hypothetical protein [Haladaptatus sp. R4]KZN25279.1 hypothetical protein A4G99_01840 [Haladaptatus sp. R4]
MVSKRRLVGNLLFLALLFVGLFHTFLTVAFHAGYLPVAIGTVVGSLLCLIAVNVPAYLD